MTKVSALAGNASTIGEAVTQLTSVMTDSAYYSVAMTRQLEAGTISPEREQALREFAWMVATTLEDPAFETKRRVMEMLEVRVDVIDREKVKVSGVISPDGSIVNIAP